MINNVSMPVSLSSMALPESQIDRPEGFQGSSKDTFVRDQEKDLRAEQSFREMGELFLAKKHKHKGPSKPRMPQTPQNPNNSQQPGKIKLPPAPPSDICDGGIFTFPGREGYQSDFLGISYDLPELGDSIKDHVSYRLDKPGECVLDYTHFSIVMNKDRRQCFYTAVNIDGTQSQSVKREGTWVIDGRIPREHQLGGEAYDANSLDRGHMVRRRDPAWGEAAKLGSVDTFVYTNAAMQCSGLNQKEWLALENHVLGSAQGQKMTVLTGPVFSETDRTFTNKGLIKPPTQIPEKFWKMVVWNDKTTGQLRGAAFVLSQTDILDKSNDLFKGGFEPGRFDVYQVPISQLEDMTDLHFAPVEDITQDAVRLSSDNDYAPLGL